MKRLTAVALGLASLTLLTGCPTSAHPVPRGCTRLGQHCDLGGGVLGVCSPAAAGTCDAAICLACAPQH